MALKNMAVKSLIYYILQAKLKKKWGKKANFESSHFGRNINTIFNPPLKDSQLSLTN